MVRRQSWHLLVLTLFLLTSCASLSTQVKHYDNIDKSFSSRNYKKAITEIEKARKEGKYEKKDRVLYYFDMGTALHNAGEYKESNKYLTQAEQAIEENFTKSISKIATSMILNDNILDYPGEDYEDIFINILMALNYIHLDNLEDAMVEVKRIDIKLSKLQDKYQNMAKEFGKTKKKTKFKPGRCDLRNSSLGSYLSMLLYKAYGKMDEARIDKKRVLAATHRRIENLLNMVLNPTKKGKTALYPICFIGKGPVKKPLELTLHLIPDLDVGRITVPGEENVPLFFHYEGEEDLHFKFAVPTIKDRTSRIAGVRVLVDGKLTSKMQPIEDFGKVARTTFEVKKPIIYLRAGLRTFLKTIAGEKTKDKIEKKTSDKKLLGAILKFAVDVTKDYTEQADLRCWRTMTTKAYVGMIELSPGTYDITFEYTDSRGRIIDSEIKPGVKIKKSGLNLIEGVSYQ